MFYIFTTNSSSKLSVSSISSRDNQTHLISNSWSSWRSLSWVFLTCSNPHWFSSLPDASRLSWALPSHHPGDFLCLSPLCIVSFWYPLFSSILVFSLTFLEDSSSPRKGAWDKHFGILHVLNCLYSITTLDSSFLCCRISTLETFSFVFFKDVASSAF